MPLAVIRQLSKTLGMHTLQLYSMFKPRRFASTLIYTSARNERWTTLVFDSWGYKSRWDCFRRNQAATHSVGGKYLNVVEPFLLIQTIYPSTSTVTKLIYSWARRRRRSIPSVATLPSLTFSMQETKTMLMMPL